MPPYVEPVSHGSRYITLNQFCERFQCHRSTAYRLAHARAFTIVKFGRSSRIALSEVEAWAASLPTMGR